MEQQTVNSQTVENSTPATAKVVKPQPESKVIALPIKGEPKRLFSLQLDAVSKSIGKYCAESILPLVILFNGCEIEIPAGKTLDGKQRFLKTVKNLIAAIYKGLENMQTPTDKNSLAILTSLKKSGFHFADFSRCQVFEGVLIPSKNYQSKISLAKNVTREIKENKVMITETGTANRLNKLIKTEGLSAALKEVEAMRKEKGLNGITSTFAGLLKN